MMTSSFMGSSFGVEVEELQSYSSELPTPLHKRRLRYNPTHVQKKHIGFDSLKRYRGMKPQRHHSLAAFSICAPVLAAQVGGAQAPAGFAPRFTSLSTRLSRRLCLTADATVVFTNQLEHHMAKASSSTSAQITSTQISAKLRDINSEASYVLNSISAVAWAAQIAIEHSAQQGIANGVSHHFKALFELIQAKADIFGNDWDCQLTELCESISGAAHD